MNRFDIIVIGAGHAGCEAALAPARMGLSVLLVTLSRSAVGRMSCNPAIGGLAKGQLVREIDALGGEMAVAIDRTGIHFRILNGSRGPAVRAPRAQADREGYAAHMRAAVEAERTITLVEAEVTAIAVEKRHAAGVVTAKGGVWRAGAVILAAGTFLGGRMYAGEEKLPGGRRGERPADRLAESMRAVGFRTARLKTGTPPRIAGPSIDYDKTDEQKPDDPPRPFSFRHEKIDRPQVSCWTTRTTEETHRIIRAHLDRSPLYTGRIRGTGPRYCPAIEEKVVRFAHHPSHQIFLETEGNRSGLVYPNGISTSLPAEAQRRFVRTIPGLERAEIAVPGYAVEYDFFPTDQIRRSLETRRIAGLYFAGQVNGTSGYEEAAAQGLVAGINAALRLDGKEPLAIGRSEAYIGVLVDDLVTREPVEPYRMFTSRAEHRLLLRHDTADIRLAARGHALGLVPAGVLRKARERDEQVEREIAYLESRVVPAAAAGRIVVRRGGVRVDAPVSLAALLRRPKIRYDDIAPLRDGEPIPARAVRHEAEVRVKYAGYVRRQHRIVARLAAMEGRRFPATFDFGAISGLSTEGKEKLARFRPETVGVASRIDGVTPADLVLLVVHLDRRTRARAPR